METRNRKSKYQTKVQFNDYIGNFDALNLEQRKTLAKFIIYGGPKKKNTKNNYSIYGKEINYTDRLIFVYDNDKNGTVDLIQEELLNHDYKNLKLLQFTNDEMIRHIDAHRKKFKAIPKDDLIEQLLKYFAEIEDKTYCREDFEREKTDFEIFELEKKEILEQKHISFEDKSFILDPEQVKISRCIAEKINLPLSVDGVAGAGKTFTGKSSLEKSTALQVLTEVIKDEKNTEIRIYLTQNPELLKKTENDLRASIDSDIDINTLIEFHTFQSFLEKYDPMIKKNLKKIKYLDRQDFCNWLIDKIKKPLEIELKAKTKKGDAKVDPTLTLINKLGEHFYEEVITAISCYNRDKLARSKPGSSYAQLGIRQCLTQKGTEREIIQKIAFKYTEELKGAIDLSFYDPQELECPKDFMLIIDEFQDLTLQQKQILITACKGQACVFNDHNQNLNSLKSTSVFFTYFTTYKFSRMILTYNYRCDKKITAAANPILETIFVDGKNDQHEITWVNSPDDKADGEVTIHRETTHQFISKNVIDKFDKNQAIICFTQEDKDLFLKHKYANVYLIQEYKGLQCQTGYVIQPISERWKEIIKKLPNNPKEKLVINENLKKDDDVDMFLIMKHEVYTAFTRVENKLIIVQCSEATYAKKMLARIEAQVNSISAKEEIEDEVKQEVKEEKQAHHILTAELIKEWEIQFNNHLKNKRIDQARQIIELLNSETNGVDARLKTTLQQTIGNCKEAINEITNVKKKKKKKNDSKNKNNHEKLEFISVPKTVVEYTNPMLKLPMPIEKELMRKRIELGVQLGKWKDAIIQANRPLLTEICRWYTTIPAGMWEQLPIKNEGETFGETLQTILRFYLYDICSSLANRKLAPGLKHITRFITVAFFEYITDVQQVRNVEVLTVLGHMPSYIDEDWFDVNQKNKSNDTALIYTSQDDAFSDLTEALLRKEADINVIDNEGLSPLLKACIHTAAKKTVWLLIKNGARTDNQIVSKDNESLLFYAASRQDIELAKFLIKQGHDVNLLSKANTSPLMGAVLENNLAMVKFLISAGAQISSQKPEPFIIACEQGKLDMVKYFIDSKLIEFNELNEWIKIHKNSPLFLACSSGHVDIAKYILKHGVDVNLGQKGGTPLQLACEKNNLNLVELLVNNKANINLQNDEGASAFYFAVQNSNQKMMQLLIKHGADINQATNEGLTPFMLACYLGNLDVLKFLYSQGADINREAKSKLFPLYFACCYGKTNVLKWLVEEKLADVNQLTEDEHSSLYITVTNGHKEVADFLIAHGATYDKQNKNGETLLHAAAYGGNIELIEYFFNKGMDINKATINKGFTPLLMATENGALRAVKWFIEHGADINQTLISGVTAIQIAFANGHQQVMSYINSQLKNPIQIGNELEIPIELIRKNCSNKEVFRNQDLSVVISFNRLNCAILCVFETTLQKILRDDQISKMSSTIASLELALLIENKNAIEALLQYKNKDSFSIEFIKSLAKITLKIREECGFKGNSEDKLIKIFHKFILNIYNMFMNPCSYKVFFDFINRQLAQLSKITDTPSSRENEADRKWIVLIDKIKQDFETLQFSYSPVQPIAVESSEKISSDIDQAMQPTKSSPSNENDEVKRSNSPLRNLSLMSSDKSSQIYLNSDRYANFEDILTEKNFGDFINIDQLKFSPKKIKEMWDKLSDEMGEEISKEHLQHENVYDDLIKFGLPTIVTKYLIEWANSKGISRNENTHVSI